METADRGSLNMSEWQIKLWRDYVMAVGLRVMDTIPWSGGAQTEGWGRPLGRGHFCR